MINKKNSLRMSIFGVFFWQSISLTATFLSIPYTINYLGKNNYGLWITIYTTLLWINNFDFGTINVFRNFLAISIAKEDKKLQKKLSSTIYLFLISVSFFVSLISLSGLILSSLIYHNTILTVSCLILTTISIDMVCRVILTIYTADQKSVILPMVTSIINILLLIIIYILFKYNILLFENKLITYSLIMPTISLCVNFVITIYSLNNKYINLAPSIEYFSTPLLKKMIQVGFLFFIIQISMPIVMQISNILIASIFSTSDVTTINIAEKYFGIISLFGSVILFPFWSKFTHANVNNEHQWIKNTLLKLEKLFLIFLILSIFFLFFSKYFYSIWIGKIVEIPFIYSVVVMLKYLSIVLNSIYSYYLNGIGDIKLQAYFYVILATLALPVSCLMIKFFGLLGIILYPTIGMVLMAYYQRKHSFIILNKKLQLQ